MAGARDVKGITLEPTGLPGRSSIQPSKISGDLTGELIVVQHSTTGQYGDVKLTIDGDATGDITIPELLELTIGGNLSGDVEIGTTLTPDLTGDLSVGGVLKSDVHVEGDVTSSGSIAVTGALGGRARILIDGQCDGSISIGTKTDSLTLIHLLDGLGSGGSIEINASEGNFDADGDIHVGPSGLSIPDITFDGCIHIYDKLGSGDGGDLNGALTIQGCHDDDLDICIDGSDNGNVTITQTGCTNQVDWSCPAPACP